MQNSSNSLDEANMGQIFPQSNAYGDCYVASSPSNSSSLATSFNGGCASPNSCDGLSVGAQNEILQVLESFDDLEFETKTQIHALEDVFSENAARPFTIEDQHNPWDEAAFDLLTSDEFIDLSCLDDTLSFKTEEGVADSNIYGSPENSLEEPPTTISHFHYPPADRIGRPNNGQDVEENNGLFLKEVENLTEISSSRIGSHSIVPRSITNIHIHPLQKCMSPEGHIENQLYGTHSSHTPTSEVQGSPSNSQFTIDGELMGCTTSLEYTIDRQIMDSNTCGNLQSIRLENPWIDSTLMPKVEESTSVSIKQEMQISTQYQEEQGLQLVHLLLLCAEMLSERKYNVVHPLLRSLQMMSSPNGNPLERIAFHFSEVLLKMVGAIIPIKDFDKSTPTKEKTSLSTCATSLEQMEIDAFHIALYQALPYTKFLHFTANQAILEAVEDSSQIHVIDFDIQQGMQWANFFQSLVGRAQGPPESIKLSAIGSCIKRLNQTGRMLAEFAQTLSLNFTFCPIVIRDVKELDVGMFTMKRCGDIDHEYSGHDDDDDGDDVYEDNNSFLDEAIALNFPAILHSQLWEEVTTETFLMLVKKLQPRVISIMKAEKNNEAPSFVHKFIEVLFYYSAFFDSLEGSMDRRSEERARIEKVFLSYGLKNIMSDTGEDELAMEASMERWQEILNRAGFYSTQFSNHAIYQAKLLLRLHASEAFRIEGSQTTSALSINWKETPLFAVMAFSPAHLEQVF